MEEKRRFRIPDSIVVVAGLLLLLAAGLAAVLSQGGEFSVWERRYLAERPSAPDLTYWKTDKAVESFLTDHVPGRRFTLHRGFESVRDQSKALEQAVDLGIEFILTGAMLGGGAYDFERIMRLHEQAAGRIKIMVALGGAFKTPELPKLLIPGMPFDYHIVNGYRKRPSHMRYVPGMEPGDDDYLAKHLSTVDYLEESAVREIRDIMDKFPEK